MSETVLERFVRDDLENGTNYTTDGYIAILKAERDKYKNCLDWFGIEILTDDSYQFTPKKMTKLEKAQYFRDNWIPVSERLPEKKENIFGRISKQAK